MSTNKEGRPPGGGGEASSSSDDDTDSSAPKGPTAAPLPSQGAGDEDDDSSVLMAREKEEEEEEGDDGDATSPRRGGGGEGDEEEGEEEASGGQEDGEGGMMPPEGKPSGPSTPNTAATKIQGIFRRKRARDKAHQHAHQIFHQEFDRQLGHYVYVNKKTGERRAKKPMFYHEAAEDSKVQKSVTLLQAYVRSKLNKKVVLEKKKELFTKHYDPESGVSYYLDKRSGVTSWNKPYGMGRDDVDYAYEDSLISKKDEEIRKLQAQLEAKTKEVQQVLLRRAEEAEMIVRRQKIEKARIEGAEKRTADMDLWTMEEVIAWLIEEGLGEYEKQIVKNRVDGFVMVHLDSGDWDDMGIRNKIHQKRLDLLLEPFRARFKTKGHLGVSTTEHSSTTSLSNTVSLSEIMSRHEGNIIEEEDILPLPSPRREGEEGLAETSAITSVHEEETEEDLKRALPPTEEELEMKRRDKENILVEVIHEGADAKPCVGDVVQVHYSTYLVDTGKCIESSRNNRRRPFEFAIGLGQVIKAWDRALLDVGMGGRVKLQVTPEYAYGSKGLPPLIPPNTELLFDIEVLSFRNRPVWHKRYIQPPGLSETPYYTKPSEFESDYEKYVKGLKDMVKGLEKIKQSAQGEKMTKALVITNNKGPTEQSRLVKATGND